jgi:alanine-synthesizing transaminase
MAGWRVGFVVGNAEMVSALGQLKSYLDYGTFQPIQIASIIALNEHDAYIGEVVDEYRARRDALIEGLASAGWEVEPPKATMFVWARIPASHRDMGSLEFALDLLDKAEVAVSPGIGFGPSGDGFVRFALVENTQRINQAMRNIRRYFLGKTTDDR